MLIDSGRAQDKPKLSEASETCLSCHTNATPGIMADWGRSRHAKVTPGEGIKKPPLERRISNEKVPESFAKTVVGCAECHTLNSEKHKDSFEHNGYKVHTVVSSF